MAAASFAVCMKDELTFEGGKVNNPADPGGKTNEGVTQRTYAAWKRNHGTPAGTIVDVDNMTDVERDAIYRTQYWDAVQADKLPEGLDLAVFDWSVNSGPLQAIKGLQRALGGIAVDGHLGQETLDAIAANDNNDALVGKICALRLAFMRALKTWKTFGKGWSNRVGQVLIMGQQMATGAEKANAVPAANSNIKADIADAKTATGGIIGHVGAGLGAGTAAVAQTTAAVTPATSIPFFEGLLPWITGAGVILVVAGGAYAAYVSNRQKQLDADLLKAA